MSMVIEIVLVLWFLAWLFWGKVELGMLTRELHGIRHELKRDNDLKYGVEGK